MDPNKKEPLEAYEKNAKIMYYVGFALMPLSWLLCWLYSSARKHESGYLEKISTRSFYLFWISIFIIGIWTTVYSAYWPSFSSIAYNYPVGEPQ